MKQWVKMSIWVGILMFGLCLQNSIALTGHYTNGAEGIKAASLPPPGYYWRLYNCLYTSNENMDAYGNKLPIDFDITLYGLINRFIWVSKTEILGGNYFSDLIIPVLNIDLKVGALGVDDREFGLSDICFEPFGISWHGAQYDAAVAFGVYAPTGEADEPVALGKDYWTGMFTWGGTYYLDSEKTLSGSVLARYEIHTEQNDSDIRAGNDFHFEWGLGKTIAKVWDVGLAGYCHWQVSQDSGKGSGDIKDRVYGIGPEVIGFLPPIKLFVSLRGIWEFEAKDRPEGTITTLTLTKIF
ncbi:MAG: transporter [Desulfobacterales bacterium]|nr:transporter [Desulfobacterales bacterium]